MAEKKAERSSLKRWPQKPDGSYGSSEPERKAHVPKATESAETTASGGKIKTTKHR